MNKTNSPAEAKALIEQQETLKKRAARQAAKRELAPETHPEVECTVLPQGHGKISMGEHIAGLGTAHYEEGETFTVELPIAVALYDRGYALFEGGREASAAAKRARAGIEAAERAGDEALAKLIETP